MGDKSAIEWTDATWNPITGCSKVSWGCKFCYAEREFPRVYPGRAFTDVKVHEDRLNYPLRWKRPRRIFVNSLSDLFHPAVDDVTIRLICHIMQDAPQHTFQILTKRPERMKDWHYFGHPSMRHIQLGVSIEDQPTADERIPLLLQTPAAVRWVSYEPALGPVDIKKFIHVPDIDGLCSLCGDYHEDENPSLNWVVAGGESGPKARPSHPDWFRSVRDQCQAAGVPLFFKQWGEYAPLRPVASGEEVNPANRACCITAMGERVLPDWCSNSYEDIIDNSNAWLMTRVGKKHSGRLLDGREWNEMPEARR